MLLHDVLLETREVYRDISRLLTLNRYCGIRLSFINTYVAFITYQHPQTQLQLFI